MILKPRKLSPNDWRKLVYLLQWEDPEVCAYTAPGGFPDGAVVKNPPAFAGDAEDTSLIPGSGRFPWKRVWQATPVFLPGKFHGQRGQAGYSPQSCKVLDTTEHAYTHTLLQSFSSAVNSNYSDNWLDYAHIVVCIPFSASVPPILYQYILHLPNNHLHMNPCFAICF